jgi:hypothetical protein
MSALALTRSLSAVAVNLTSSFLGAGGTPPYSYLVLPGGAGGVINSSTGLYTAPAVVSSNPNHLYDTIQVTDSLSATATAQILVGTPLLLFCDIIQSEMALAIGRVYLWDQKIMQPTDSGLYVAVSVPSCKPFANTLQSDGSGSGLNSVQAVNMLATVDIDIISRGPDARDRKEEVILALNSVYCQAQQEANSFLIGKLPAGSTFLNLSQVDGAAIPYRYKISVNMQYAVINTKGVPYYDRFGVVQVTNNS